MTESSKQPRASKGSKKDSTSATAELLVKPIFGPRAEAVERLRPSALKGIASFEKEMKELIFEMAATHGYSNPRSVTLSQMQTAKDSGASSLYVYYCGFKRLIEAEDWVSIRDATSTSLAKSRIRAQPTLTPEQLVDSLRKHQEAGRLSSAHYSALERLLRSRKI